MVLFFKAFVNLLLLFFIIFSLKIGFENQKRFKKDIEIFQKKFPPINSETNILVQENSNKENTNVLCLILTNDKQIENRAIPVYKTWAKKCDKSLFVFNAKNFSNILKTEEGKHLFQNENDVLNLPIMHLNVNESKNEMGIKVLKLIQKVYSKYKSEFKWFLLTDDDTFIFVDNLYKFISKKSYNDPLTYGYNFKTVVPIGFHSGGAGILLPLESLKRISESINNGICFNKMEIYGDITLGYCSYYRLVLIFILISTTIILFSSNVAMGNSLDELGRERFHFDAFPAHYKGTLPDWATEYSSNGIKSGEDCCSDETISFHYTSTEQMQFYANLFNVSFFKNIFNVFQ